MMKTKLHYYGCSNEQFGWLLKDVPESCRFSEKCTNKFVDHTGEKRKECWWKLKTTNLNQSNLSKTPTPHRKRNSVTYNQFNSWPSPRLSHMIELDDNEGIEEPRYQFFKVATDLDNRLEDMSFQTINLHNQTKTLKQAYEELDDTTNQLLTEVRHLTANLQYIRNMEDLIRLLDGKTEQISSQKWPFVMGHSPPFTNLNLII